MTDAAALVATLEGMATAEEREKYTRYFAPDPDAPFIGVRMGAVFELAKTALDLPAPELEALLEQPTHEVRALACSIMGKSAAHRKTSSERRTELYDLYLRRHDRIDQWDLVDLAARDVVGGYLLERDRAPLARLAASGFWPERRTALVATFAFLKRGEVDDAFALAETLADDPEPLVQKALGWVLRAAGDLDRERLTDFVERHAAHDAAGGAARRDRALLEGRPRTDPRHPLIPDRAVAGRDLSSSGERALQAPPRAEVEQPHAERDGDEERDRGHPEAVRVLVDREVLRVGGTGLAVDRRVEQRQRHGRAHRGADPLSRAGRPTRRGRPA